VTSPCFSVLHGSECATHLPVFIELLEEAGSWLWDRGIHQWEPGSQRALEPYLRWLAESGSLVLAHHESRLAAGAILASAETPEWSARPGRAIYLHKLAVARFAAGQRLGQVVLARCEQEVVRAGFDRLRLDCWDGNAKLRAYYRSADFQELEAVPSHGYLVRLFEKSLGDPGRP
jgi:GNAT superfamily N-acetyltransferase